MPERPIADYALLSDCRTAALVSRDGSVDWLCFPRFDSPSVFGRLLDEDAGHFRIGVEGASTGSRRYLDGTMVLETTTKTDHGTVVLVDALALGGDREHELGAHAPGVLLRRATCVAGEVTLAVELAPRPEYGIVQPLLIPTDEGIAVRGGPVVLCLSGDRFEVESDGAVRGRVQLRAGETASFALSLATTSDDSPAALDPKAIAAGIDDTVEAWRSWSAQHQRYEGPYRDEVHASGRLLQALTYFPTGAIVAAATTSLPEVLGGERNWDYRFTWIRDASMTLEALWVAACPDEASKFLDFIASAAMTRLRRTSRLQIMFGIGGEHDLTERDLGHLAGYAGSRPVRIGNAAWRQRQFDVFGELLAAVYRLRDYMGDIDPTTRAFLVEVADAAMACSDELDQGIWEVRGPPRHFLHSKLMSWVALDRAILLAALLGAEARVARWTEARDAMKRDLLARGYNAREGAFTQTMNGRDLDASSLLVPIVGLLPPDDPRVLSTIDAVESRLMDARGLVHRYRTSDGLSGREGAFLLCTFWLAQAEALAGRVDRARAVFERAAAYANDVGLLSEEVDVATGALLGNFPQAFSHIGLVNAAWAIHRAERRLAGRSAA
jgi:GH15 family glucan-1,4-alpha-glucosidase